MIRPSVAHTNAFRIEPAPKEIQTTALLFHTLNRQATLVTSHPVVEGKLAKGQLVDNKQVAQFLIERNLHNTSAFLPEHVLMDSEDYLVWHKPSFEKAMWFTRNACSDGQRKYNVRWPNLLFVVGKHGGGVRVFATATAKRPTPKTKVYLAPLYNISLNGQLCLGGATMPEKVCVDTIADIEAGLIDTNFSHTNYKAISHPRYRHYVSRGAHIDYWQRKTNDRVYASELIPIASLDTVLDYVKLKKPFHDLLPPTIAKGAH